MRVALVNTSLPFGGTTTFSLFLALGLRELGVSVRIFSLGRDHPMESEFDRLDVPVYRCDDRKLIFEDRLADVLGQLRAYAPSCVIAGLGPPAFEILRYVPDGIFRIGMLQDHHSGVYKLVQTYRPYVDHFAAVSRTIKVEVAEKYPEVSCRYLPYGIRMGNTECRSSKANQPIKILYFGRLYQTQKQVRMFPEIWRALREQGIPFQWTILGEGPEEPFLRKELVEGVQAGEIVFSSPIHDRRELSHVVAAHDIFLLCSAHEGLPLALLEAMGHGLVPVCGDIPSLAQGAISADNGFLVPQGDPGAYARAIGDLHRDRPLLERMSARSKVIFDQEYTHVAMARRYLELMETDAPREAIAWPAASFPQPPLGMEKALYMNPKLLPLRRLYKRLRSLGA